MGNWAFSSGSGMVQLSLTVLLLTPYLKSQTLGGLEQVGGCGGPFLPQPHIITAGVTKSSTARAIFAARPTFTFRVFI